MPKIEITTDRRPWVDGKPQTNGAMLDVDDATADAMVANGRCHYTPIASDCVKWFFLTLSNVDETQFLPMALKEIGSLTD